MTTTISFLPAGLDVSGLVESESIELPAIRRAGGILYFPALVREATRQVAGDVLTVYRYFDVPVAFTGQDTSDYERCKLQSYAAIRKFFYGDFAKQNEQILKGTFARHQYAVKTAFPKAAGEVLHEVERFNAVKTEFWAAVDAACAAVGVSRASLPAKFNSDTMIQFAVANGMSAAQVAEFSQTFFRISLDLLQNGRNWDELFDTEEEA